MNVIRRIYAVLTPSQRRTAATLMLLVIVGTAFETLGIGLVIPLAALLVQDGSTTFGPLLPWLGELYQGSREWLLTVVMVGFVGVYALKVAFLAFLAWRQSSFEMMTQAQLAQRLFTVYLRQPYTFHLQRNSAELIGNVTTEVGLFTTAVTNLLTIAGEGLLLLCVVALLLAFEPWGTVIVVTVLGAAMWGVYRATRSRISRWGAARQHHDAQRMLHLQQGLDGAKDVKLLGREDDFIAQYELHMTQSSRIQQRQRTLHQIPRLWLELLAVIGLAGLVLGMHARGDDSATIVPMLGLFAVAAFRLMPSANRVLGALQMLRYALPAIDVVSRELRLDVPGPETTYPATAGFHDEIRFADVSYAYPGSHALALKGVSLRIARGESVGITGPTGAGKSTLVDVLLGLLAPSTGQVLMDGRDIQRDLRGWQDQIGYVPQSIYLTDDTLRRNVAFGVPAGQIDDAAVRRAVRAAQLEEFVATLRDGLETLVGENGVRLSGGQRQRLGIARALYHDPPAIVLDEATSALDVATEQGVMRAVAALHGHKTIVIVAHRLSTVEECDRLYHLENGTLATEVVRAQAHSGASAVLP